MEIVVSQVGRTVLGSVIGEAYSLCKNVYSSHLSLHGGHEITKALDKLDVQAQLEAAGSLVCHLTLNQHIEQSETGLLLSSQLKEAIDRVQQDLLAISKESEEHQTRWFASYRYANYAPLLKKLTRDQQLLDTRLARLMTMAPLLTNVEAEIETTEQRPDLEKFNIDELIEELERGLSQ